MKVILQQDVKGQGKKGQMVEVSDGYARNYLVPRKLAILATADNMNAMKQQEQARRTKELHERQQTELVAKQLESSVVKVFAKAGSSGRLFGAVTSKEIADALLAQHNINIPKSKIVQEEPIKQCGVYALKCKLGYEMTGTLHVVVAEEK